MQLHPSSTLPKGIGLYPTTWVAIVCALITAGAVISPELTLLGVGAVILTAVIVCYPTCGMSVLVCLFLIEKSPMYQQYAVLAKAGSVADLLAALVIIAAVAQATRAGDDPLGLMRGRRVVPLLAVAAYFLWGVAACLWSNASEPVLETFLRNQLEAPLLLIVGLLVLRGRDRVRWAMSAYALTGLGLALYVISNFVALHGLGGPLTLGQQEAYRGGRTGFNYNELSVVLALVPVMTYLAASHLKLGARLLVTFLSIPVIAASLLILASRGSIISLGAGVAMAVLLARGSIGRLSMAGFALLAAAIYELASMTGSLPFYFTQRFLLLSTDQAGGRGPVWQLGLNLFERHPMGLGAMAFEQIIPAANVTLYVGAGGAHSDYVGTLVDFGIIGAILLGAMFSALGREIVFAGGRRNPAMIVGLTVLIVAIADGSYLQTHWYWTAMTLLFCYALTQSDVIDKSAPGPQNYGLETSPA